MHTKKQTAILLRIERSAKKICGPNIYGLYMRNAQNYVFINVVVYTHTLTLTLGIGKIYFIVRE
jgi:hypothetical protein